MAAKFKLSRSVRSILHRVVEMEAGDPENTIIVDGRQFDRICQRCPVYRCKSLGLVVKQPHFIMTENTPLKVRIPTLKLNDEGWVVKPIAVKRNTNTAVSLIKKQLGDFYCDLHYLNVGWWNDKPYMFDW